MTYISCFSDFAFYFYYYFMENCHTWIIISMWQNDLHTNTSRSVWPILYGLMIKMLQYKMYPAGELAVLRQLLLLIRFIKTDWFHWYMVIVIGLKFYFAQSLHMYLTFESKGFNFVWWNSFNVITYSIQLPSPESKLHTLCSLKSGGSACRGYTCPTGHFV